MNTPTSLKALAAMLPLAVSLPLLTHAQEVSPRPDAVLAAEEAIMLNPFVVSTERDRGYIATNSVSGTRLNTALKDVPMSIEVITDQFIRDTGASSLREALTYSAGVILESQTDFDADASELTDDSRSSTGRQTDTVIKLRGFRTTEALRRGFKRENSTDSVNIARVEVVRGPSSLLYGTGIFGGIVNYLPKEPMRRKAGEVRFGVGSNEWYRTELDLTGPIGGPRYNLAYRVTAAAERANDWTEFNTREQFFVAPSFSLTPTRNSKLVVEFEYGERARDGIGFMGIRNAQQGAGGPIARQQPFVDVPGKDPKTFRWSGPDTFADNEAFNGLVEYTVAIRPNLNLNLGVNYSDVAFRNRSVGGGINQGVGPVELRQPWIIYEPGVGIGRNPRIWTNGIYQYRWSESDSFRDRVQTRAELAWQFSLGSTQHSLLLGRTDEKQESLNYSREDFTNRFRSITDFNYFRFTPEGGGGFVYRGASQTNNYAQGNYLVHHGKYFNERLQTIGGVRYDRTDSRGYDFSLADRTTVTAVRNRLTDEPPNRFSPSLGLSFALTPEISLIALYAEGLTPNYSKVDGLGNPFGPTTAKSVEAGVKIDLWNGRVSGTISAFKIERFDNPRPIWWAPAPRRNRFDPNADWTINLGGTNYTYKYADGRAVDPAVLTTIRSLLTANIDPNNTDKRHENLGGGNRPGRDYGADVLIDDESEGVDAQLILSPVRNWQTVLTLSFVERKITSGGKFVKHPVYDEFAPWYWGVVSFFDRWGAGPAAENFTDVTDSSTYQGNLLKGYSLDDTPKYVFSMWSNYRFETGRFKGLSVGLGGRYEAPRDYRTGTSGDGTIFTQPVGIPGAPENGVDTPLIKSFEERLNVDGLVSYTRRVGDNEWSASLNIYNMLNDQSRYGELYARPTHYRFSVGVKF